MEKFSMYECGYISEIWWNGQKRVAIMNCGEDLNFKKFIDYRFGTKSLPYGNNEKVGEE